MSVPQEAPIWARPEYWGGACVDARSTFNAAKRPAGPFNQLQNAAAYVLATSLESVLRGDYEQRAGNAGGSFDPQATDLEDGTVVLLERERLAREKYYVGWARPVDEQIGDLPDDIEEFAEYWRANSTERPPTSHVDFRSFGAKGEELSYQRSLQWGVVVPHLRKKVVFTWDAYDFAHATDIKDGIVRFRPEMEDLTMLPTPIPLGRAEAARKGRKSIILPRSIERTTAIQVIDAEGTADYHQAYENADPISKLATNLPVDIANLYRGAEIMIAGSFPPIS